MLLPGVLCSLLALVFSVASTSPLVGVHPLGYLFHDSLSFYRQIWKFCVFVLWFLLYACSDEKYFDSNIIRCKDGSKSFHRDRLNDNFCDCLDGTDEPGTLFFFNLILESIELRCDLKFLPRSDFWRNKYKWSDHILFHNFNYEKNIFFWDAN